jgi:tight adherence protein B
LNTAKKWLQQVSAHIEKSRLSGWVLKKYGIDTISFIKILSCGIAQLLVAAKLFYNNFSAFVFLSPYLLIYLKSRSKEIHDKKIRIFNEQFKDGMQSVAFSLNSGYSIENSFWEAQEELKHLYGMCPIVKEFQTIVYRLKRNENIEDILEDFALRSEAEDIQYFAAVFRYAKRCGGDLIGIIRQTAQTISEKSETINEIQTVISGKKMEQKVMGVIPFCIIGYLRLTSYEFIAPLYGNVLGVVVMTVCLAVYVLADYLAKRIVNIEIY